jgi:hypothetical protein
VQPGRQNARYASCKRCNRARSGRFNPMLIALVMLYTSPMPFSAAVERLESKTPVAADLSTEEWQQLAIGLRDRAFFSARVDDIRTVASMQSKIDDALSLDRSDGGAFMDRSRFVADMRAELGAAPGDSGELTDLTSYRRLGLIYDFNTEDAMEFGRWKARQDPAILDAFPCDELVRVEAREVPRGYRKGPKGRLIEVPDESWPARWAAAGGTFVGGRMIALKDDPIWKAISRFGRPWPPFDFNSGMGREDVSRDEAEELGVIDPDSPAPQPQELDFNHNLKASLPAPTPAVLEGLKDVFGDQIDVNHQGEVVWQGQRIAKLYADALADPEVKWSIDLGIATPEAIDAADQAGVDIAGTQLNLTADDLRHAAGGHAEGNEDDPALTPITALDAQLIPHVWREPDQVEAGAAQGALVFSKDIVGRNVVVTYDRQGKNRKWGVKTFYVAKTKGAP